MGGSGEMREEFLGFLHCDLGLSWKALVETVLNGIANLYTIVVERDIMKLFLFCLPKFFVEMRKLSTIIVKVIG